MAISNNTPAFDPVVLASKVSTPIIKQIDKSNKERDEALKSLAEEFLQQMKSRDKVKLVDKSMGGNGKVIETEFRRLSEKLLPSEYLKNIAKETTQKKIVEENKKISSGIAKIKELTSSTKALYREIINSNRNKAIDKLTKELHSNLQPLKIAAREDTLRKVENSLHSQSKQDNGWFKTVDDHLEGVQDNTSILSKIKEGIYKLYESSQRRLGLAVVTDKKLERMQRMVDFQRKIERTQHLRDQVSQIKTSDKAMFYLSELGNVIVPKDTIMRQIVDGVVSTAAFFGGLGSFLGNSAFKAASSLFHSAPRLFPKMVSGVLSPFASLLGALSKLSLRGILSGPSLIRGVSMLSKFLLTSSLFMGAVAALATSSVFLSLAKSPKLVAEYGEAFARIWTDNIAPAFEWLSNMGARLLAFWKSDGESGLTKIGDFINKVLIWTLGTLIPETFTYIGRTISSSVETLLAIGGDVVKLIINWGSAITENLYSMLGIFGIGPYAERGILANITTIIDNNLAMIDQFITTIANTFGNVVKYFFNFFDNSLTAIYNIVFGKTSDETIMTQFSNFLNETWNGMVNSVQGFIKGLWNSFENAWDTLVKKVNDYIWGTINDTIDFIKALNPLETIKTKISEMIEAIVGIFPSLQDIEDYMRSLVRDSEWMPDWMKNKLVGEDNKVQDLSQNNTNSMAQKNIPNSTTNIVMMNATSPKSTPPTPITSSGPRAGRGRPSTRPELSGHDQKLYGVSGFSGGSW